MPRQKRIKIGWMFGAIGLVIVLLILGLVTSDKLSTQSNQDIPVDVTNVNVGQPFELNTANLESQPIEAESQL